MGNSFFSGRKIVIATKHQKEVAIAQILKQDLGLETFVFSDFDTDTLGTFTGEVERTLSPLDAARKKCHWAMERYGFDLAIASEGSFGPHPSFPFIPANEELLLMVDRKNDLEIAVKVLDTDTNYAYLEYTPDCDLAQFLEKAQFPSHSLIVRKSVNDFFLVYKYVFSLDYLHSTLNHMMETYGECYLETDMRAMCNPSRMKVITQLTGKLVEKVQNACPKCQTPGFSVSELIRGLPCQDCGLPTKSVKSLHYSCQKCHYLKIESNSEAKVCEDPMYCDFCNP
jgi:hypothetical protein